MAKQAKQEKSTTENFLCSIKLWMCQIYLFGLAVLTYYATNPAVGYLSFLLISMFWWWYHKHHTTTNKRLRSASLVDNSKNHTILVNACEDTNSYRITNMLMRAKSENLHASIANVQNTGKSQQFLAFMKQMQAHGKRAINAPELADLFGELQVINSKQSQSNSTNSPTQEDDLFKVIILVHNWPVKDDVSSMEYPIFSLSKNHDTRIRQYSRGGKSIRIIPSAYGSATVFDKDILIYCISQIVRAADAGAQVSRRIRIDVHPFLVGTRRSTGGAAYERVVDMCRRLKGTTIETNVKTNEKEQLEGFGLIEDYRVTTWTKNQKGALELELTISEWLYRAAVEFDILTLHPDYFSLSQALERRLYELGRKHCGGNKAWWEIGLPLLHEKTGSSQSLRRFKQNIKDIVSRDALPDYRIRLDETIKPNKVVFLTRNHCKIIEKQQWLNYARKELHNFPFEKSTHFPLTPN